MADLPLLNPWWKGRQYIQEDKHIKEYEEKKYKWEPKLEIKLLPDNIFTLRGPRQVGKTTLMKLFIRNLLKENIDEKAIFFWSCDELVDFRELAVVLREYLSFSEGIRERYMFLDEVSKIKEWQRAVKSLHDSGELKGCCMMLTGSHTLDIKHGAELMPGRTGKLGKDVKLLPMSFSEYVKVIKPEIAAKIKKINLKKISHKDIKAAKIFDSELKKLFSQYLITGGFPLVINEFHNNKEIPEYVYELYYRWVIGDIVKWGRQEKIAIQLLKSIIVKQSSAISWDSLAKEAEIKSHKTVSAYVEDFENMFVLLVLYYLEINKKLPDFAKNKKLYFIDPFIYHIFRKKIYFKDIEIGPELIEAAAASNLARLSDVGLFPKAYYWKNKFEVDVLLNIKDSLFPFEIKYQNTIRREDYRGLFHFNKGILVTKHTLELGNKYNAIPAHILLAMI
ncbi:ATP-binding protein [Candidatus Woesearchaeota archaeon]|nr:ATP-binding protein [Candidatus Woesearchaeota archaeon]